MGNWGEQTLLIGRYRVYNLMRIDMRIESDGKPPI